MNFAFTFATVAHSAPGALTQTARYAATAARVTKQPGMAFLRAVDKAPAATAQTTARRGFRLPSTLKPARTQEQLIAMRMFAKPGQCC
jgi:hypothetical protein